MFLTALDITLLFFILNLVDVETTSLNPTQNGNSQPEEGNPLLETGNRADPVTESQEPFLRFIGDFRDQSLTSDEKAQFKFRVESWPNDQMTYTWYKDNELFTENEDKYRISIRNRPSGSRLTIKNLLTSDSGEYRCEASNGVQRIVRTAKLLVSFKLPPTDGHVTTLPQAKCEVYQGEVCANLLSGQKIYVDPFQTQKDMEKELKQALSHIENANDVSPNCKRFSHPAFCYFVFSPCKSQINPKTDKKKAKPIRLCREDCELMKYDVCSEEFLNGDGDDFLKEIFTSVNCSELPATTSQGTKCTKTGLPPVSDKSHKCFNDSGTDYKGIARVTKTGKICQQWPTNLVIQHSELSGGHNFCRNPGGTMGMPWCYTGARDLSPEECDVEKCSSSSQNNDMVFILVPSISIPFVLGCILVAICMCRKRKLQVGKENVKHTAEKPINMMNLGLKQAKVPELSALSIQLMVEIGDSVYGKVYKAKVHPNPNYSSYYSVAAKTVRDIMVKRQMEEFQREFEIFSHLQHENVACLKAIVVQPNLHCLIFEYTDNVDLQEYLISHSSQSDFGKPVSSGSSQLSITIEQAEFVHMAVQIASGMEYLSSNNYVHRDLAARNILVCANMDLKISNLGIVKETYLSSYYRTPQGGQMLPIRWMAPESLQSWQFSDKSTVWSFGVLLWEMFSYGAQPYCGYNNQEVLNMISSRQLLSCPDQCPAKMYSLMHECWSAQSIQRPDFKDLRAKLQGWETSNTGRVTSQLAQGIHKQLANVNKDGSGGEYNRFYQTSSLGGSSGMTFTSAMGPTPSPPPPPQYSNLLQLPGTSTSTFTSNAAAPTASTASQQFYSSSSNALPYPQTSAYNQHNSGVDQFLPVPRYSEISRAEQHQLLPPDERIPPYQRRGQTYRKGPASQSSRTSSSCASSSRDHYPPNATRRLLCVGTENGYQDRNNPPTFSGPGNRSLGNVIENDVRDNQDTNFNQSYPLPASPSHMPYVSSNNHATIMTPKKNSHQHRMDKLESSDISNSSAKATSCDSGLPAEENEANAIEANVPLLVHSPPPVPTKSPFRNGSSRFVT